MIGLRIFTTAITLFLVSTGQVFSQEKTEILWDSYGVPHIEARTEAEMYYAFGWAQMHNHANLLLKLYGQARGQAAEYWGEAYLESDKLVHLFDLPNLAKSSFMKMTADEQEHLAAFVTGINAFAKANPGQIDEKVKQVLPITVADISAHVNRVICLEFVAANDISDTKRLLNPGSNAYAIAASKSASGNPMLVANPHLPWSDLYLFFEAHLKASGFNAYGVSLLGMGALNIAFNEHLGWTHTVNTIDASDRYELSLKGSGYLLDGHELPFELRRIPIKVRAEDGSIKQQEFTMKYAKHGPVLGEKAGKAYALKIAGLENAHSHAQIHAMGKAKNLAEFESALKMLQLPMFNVIYADKKGNILYLFNGNVPKRTKGDWAFWNGTVDGTQSKYIWNSYHKYTELPRLLNPKSGQFLILMIGIPNVF